MIKFDYYCHGARCQTNMIACYVPASQPSRTAHHCLFLNWGKPCRSSAYNTIGQSASRETGIGLSTHLGTHKRKSQGSASLHIC